MDAGCEGGRGWERRFSLMKFEANQTARRKLATKLMMLRECEGINLQFGAALLAINAEFENISYRCTLSELWDKWELIHDCLLIETDLIERKRYEFMLALVGTAINEMR